jgi:ketosteroid isomerase-like protein
LTQDKSDKSRPPNQPFFACSVMPKHKTAPALAASADEIEASFYEALQSGDIDMLMACWADEDDVVCVHPGGARLVGLGAIRASFEALFANGSVQARPERIHRVLSVGASIHSVVERIAILTPEGPAQAWVIATNVYHHTALGWRMVVHHASPGTANEAQNPPVPSAVLH